MFSDQWIYLRFQSFLINYNFDSNLCFNKCERAMTNSCPKTFVCLVYCRAFDMCKEKEVLLTPEILYVINVGLRIIECECADLPHSDRHIFRILHFSSFYPEDQPFPPPPRYG